MPGNLPSASRKPLFSRSSRMLAEPSGVPQKDDVARSVEQLGHVLTGQLAAFEIIRGDKADVFVRLQPGVHHGFWNAGLNRARHGIDQGLRIKRREHDAVHASAGEIFHHLDFVGRDHLRPGNGPFQMISTGVPLAFSSCWALTAPA